MLLKISVSCMGYSVGGHDNTFDLEIDDILLKDLSEDEKDDYIQNYASEYILGNLDIGIDY